MAKRLISEFLCIASAGATADNRTIEASWLTDMGGNYSLDTYMAMIWPEHFKYQSMGHVEAAYASTGNVNGQSVVKLFAQLSPTTDLLYNLERGRTMHPSIEVNKNFANTGNAYLAGLGVTTQPASLGTDSLHFSRKNPDIEIFTFADAIPDTLNFREFEDSTTYFDVGAWFAKKPETPPTVNQTEEFTVTKEDADQITSIVSAALEKFSADQEKKFDEKLTTALADKLKPMEDKVEGFSTQLEEFRNEEFKLDDPRGEHAGGGDPDALPDDIC